MNSNGWNICRLCLQISSNVIAAEKIIQEKLSTLLSQLDLTISEEPMVCEDCVEVLKKCVDFKTMCLYIKDDIDLHFKDKNNVDICINNDPGLRSADIPNALCVCHFCKELPKSDLFTVLVNIDTDVIKMLEKYFPELPLLTTDTEVCVECYEILQNISHFITNCLNVEEKIREYCEVEGTNGKGQVELQSVILFTPKNALKIESCHKSPDGIKLEKQCDNENGIVDIKTEVKEEIFKEVEEQTLNDEEELTDSTVDEKHESRFQDELLLLQESIPELSDVDRAVVTYKCKICTYETQYKSNLRRHIQIHENNSEMKIHVCKVCSFLTTHQSSLKIHMLTHKTNSDVTVYKCEMCEYQTKHKGHFKSHALIHKSTAEVTMHKCELCSFETIYKKYLHTHMLTHKSTSEKIMHKCELCTFQTAYRGNLRKHMVIHQSISEVIMHKCSFCAFQTKHKHSLRQHVQSHKSPCDACGYQNKRFAVRSDQQPRKTTDKPPLRTKRYQCGICTFHTNRKSSLQTHMMIHRNTSELQMYRCEVCTFQTKYKSNLRSHVLTHRDKIYKCEICVYQTKCKRDFQIHLPTHEVPAKVRVHKCPNCAHQSV